MDVKKIFRTAQDKIIRWNRKRRYRKATVLPRLTWQAVKYAHLKNRLVYPEMGIIFIIIPWGEDFYDGDFL